MSVSSITFDLLFDNLQRKEKRLFIINRNYERAEGRLERLLEKPDTPKRQERIEGILDTQIWRINRTAEIEDTITGIKSVLPKDEFIPEFWVNDEGENWGIQVTITDSPYDDTYVGGTPMSLQVTGRYCATGQSGFAQTRGVYFGEKYPLIDATETIGYSTDRVNGDYSITVRLLDSNTRVPFYEQELIDSDGVQLI